MNYESQNIENFLKQDIENQERTLESLEHQIAERMKIKYQNIKEFDLQRRKIEEILNQMYCLGYNPNPRVVQVRSQLQTEMIRLELKKGEEAVNAFRDVERLESEKRRLLGDIRDNKSMGYAFGGFP